VSSNRGIADIDAGAAATVQKTGDPRVVSLDTAGQRRAVAHRHTKARRRGSYYAIAACKDVITLPQTKPLGYLTQARLFRAAQSGDLEARHRIWLAHARLAYTVINRTRVPPDHVPDAIQASMIGLHRAIDRFEIDRLNEFSTYAFHWIRQAIQRYRHTSTAARRIPSHLYASYCQYRHQIVEEPDRAKSHDALCKFAASQPDFYERIRRLHPLAHPETLTSGQHAIDQADNPLHAAIRTDTAQLVRAALASLSDKQREILIRRYGLGDRVEETLETIGRELGITRERIRQLQSKAEARLRFQIILLAPHFARSMASPMASTPPTTATDSVDTAPVNAVHRRRCRPSPDTPKPVPERVTHAPQPPPHLFGPLFAQACGPVSPTPG